MGKLSRQIKNQTCIPVAVSGATMAVHASSHDLLSAFAPKSQRLPRTSPFVRVVLALWPGVPAVEVPLPKVPSAS